MRISICLLFFLSISIFSENLYYNSNNSGMILDKINYNEIEDFYVIEEVDNEIWTKTYTFYENEIVFKTQVNFYTDNFYELIKVVNTEDGLTIEYIYSDNLLFNVITYNNGKLVNKEVYTYNKRKLINVICTDINEEILYVDKYFRNKDGSLRKLIRQSSDDFLNHWLYKDGIIIESWLVKGDLYTRTKYNLKGKIVDIIQYKDNITLSSEHLDYNTEGMLITSSKISGTRVIQKIYNLDGNIEESKVLDNGILVQKNNYEYNDNLISKEIVTGHGKHEETLYERDESDEVSSIHFYINGELKKIKLIDGEDSEIFEYYRNNVIYLKEFFIQGERIQRDLYLDGKLFKSESKSE